MSWIAGVDGCKGGWFRVCRDTETREMVFDVIGTAEEIATRLPNPSIIAIDIPIGLPNAGSRECDLLARKHLVERQRSVFPAPIRPALNAASQAEASQITRQADGRGVSAQAWELLPKIKAVDDALRSNQPFRGIFHEVHPKVSFWAWNRRTPMRFPKKTPEGHCERLALAEHWLGDDLLIQARGSRLRRHVADDDILDAIAALWTAHRIASGVAERLPPSPPMYGALLPMQIVF